MNRNISAFIIAFLLHVILLLLILLVERNIPEKKVEPKKEQKRMKVSLKENPKAKKDSLVKNKDKPKKQDLPMPKGKQLKEIVKQPLIKPSKKVLEKKSEPVPKPKKIEPKKEIAKPTKTEPIPPKKPLIKVPKETAPKPLSMAERLAKYNEVKKAKETNTTKPKKEHSNLYAILSKETPSKSTATNSKQSKKVPRFTQQIKEAYGSDWGKLSAGEQKYILDNQEIMRRLTQTQLYATGSTDIPNNLRVNEINIIEFYLHTNGDMTDFKIVKNSNFFLLDDVTKDVIESVYSKYPRPKQKTLIRYKFWYNLRGY